MYTYEYIPQEIDRSLVFLLILARAARHGRVRPTDPAAPDRKPAARGHRRSVGHAPGGCAEPGRSWRCSTPDGGSIALPLGVKWLVLAFTTGLSLVTWGAVRPRARDEGDECQRHYPAGHCVGGELCQRICVIFHWPSYFPSSM